MKHTHVKVVDKLVSAHNIVHANFASPNTIEGRRAIAAINILRKAIDELNEMDRERRN